MGHDLHFLERLSRVEAEDESLALSLYQDPQLVRTILSLGEFPDGAERVALALKDGPEAPHIVVTRDGAFVTCLGAGMSTGSNPVVTRHQLEGMRVRAERVRAAFHLADSVVNDKNHKARPILGRLWRVGDQATIEDYELMTTFVPLLGWDMMRSVFDQSMSLLDTYRAARHLVKVKRATRSADIELLREIYFKLWCLGHYLIIASGDPQLFKDASELLESINPFQVGQYTSSAPIVARGLWSASRFAPLTFEYHQQRLIDARNPDDLDCAALSLAAGACRHSKLRDEATRVLERARRATPKGLDASMVKYRDSVLDVCLHVIAKEYDVEGLRLRCLGALNQAMVKDDLQAGPIPEELLRASCAQPFGFTRLSAIPGCELLRWSLVSKEAPFGLQALKDLLVYVPIITSFNGSDFFLPPGCDVVPRQHDIPLDAMLAILREDASYRRPITRPATPKRNAPCTCGSGRKYKHCCAGH